VKVFILGCGRCVRRSGAARADLIRASSNLSKSEFLGVWRATTEFVVPEPDTPVPLLLMRGERDRSGNIATGRLRWAEAEGVREIVVPGAGHVVTQDAPPAVSDALLASAEGPCAWLVVQRHRPGGVVGTKLLFHVPANAARLELMPILRHR
jgi:hypothetical protein